MLVKLFNLAVSLLFIKLMLAFFRKIMRDVEGKFRQASEIPAD